MTDLQAIPQKILDGISPVTEYQLDAFFNRKTPIGKENMKNSFELVSEVDVNSEHMLQEILARILPEASFYGEETVQDRGMGKYMWVVDPIDGTTNFLNGIDMWSVSIALLQDEKPAAAVICRPTSGEVFTAVRGSGASMNGSRLPRNTERPLSGALIGTGTPFRSPDSMDSFFPCSRKVLGNSLDIRRMGSAAIDLCYVGANKLQGFWEIDLNSYDVAAALLVLEETGCLYSDAYGNPYDMFSSQVLVAGQPGLFTELQEIIQEFYT